MIFYAYECGDWRLPLDEATAEWVDLVIQHNNYRLASLTFVFCTDAYLRPLNRDYLGHDYETDILTFDYAEQAQEINSDIFISIDRVAANAQDWATNFIDELHRVMIHGVLHLMGLDDHDEQARRRMRQSEDLALALRMF
jgi:rRNA maturation RNase YbeY